MNLDLESLKYANMKADKLLKALNSFGKEAHSCHSFGAQ
uniref:Uncharacterized protein n=1 Tax=Erpetoichthys calabaricus TaxID=27687 RepID=A0A8C4TRX9_ERPCA